MLSAVSQPNGARARREDNCWDLRLKGSGRQCRGLRHIVFAVLNVTDLGANSRGIPMFFRHPFVDGATRIHSDLCSFTMSRKRQPKWKFFFMRFLRPGRARESRIIVIRNALDEPVDAVLPLGEGMVADCLKTLAMSTEHLDSHQLACHLDEPRFQKRPHCRIDDMNLRVLLCLGRVTELNGLTPVEGGRFKKMLTYASAHET